MAFSPDGKRVVYRNNNDDVMHVANVSTRKTSFTLQLTSRAVIRTVRYRPDGKRILIGDTWGGVQIWCFRVARSAAGRCRTGSCRKHVTRGGANLEPSVRGRSVIRSHVCTTATVNEEVFAPERVEE
jgi:hypothetical protein